MEMKKLTAEFFGTMWLVIGGCGSALLSAAFPELGIGLLGVSFAFGLTVLTMAYAIGPISGCHLNPAVTIGLAVAGKHEKKSVLSYIIAQCLGAIVGTLILYLILKGQDGFTTSTFAANGFGENSPGHFNLVSGFLTETIMTAFFLLIILGSTSPKASAGFAPLAIGLGLTLIHLISIPVTNTSVNPARSLGPALFAGGTYLTQVWLFWVAPILGAIIGSLIYSSMNNE